MVENIPTCSSPPSLEDRVRNHGYVIFFNDPFKILSINRVGSDNFLSPYLIFYKQSSRFIKFMEEWCLAAFLQFTSMVLVGKQLFLVVDFDCGLSPPFNQSLDVKGFVVFDV